MSAILFQCPSCHKNLKATARAAGKTVPCPKCRAKCMVPKLASDLPQDCPVMATEPVVHRKGTGMRRTGKRRGLFLAVCLTPLVLVVGSGIVAVIVFNRPARITPPLRHGGQDDPTAPESPPLLPAEEDEYQRLRQEIETQRQNVAALQERLKGLHPSAAEDAAYEQEQRSKFLREAAEAIDKEGKHLVELAGRRNTWAGELEYQHALMRFGSRSRVARAEAEVQAARAVEARAAKLMKEHQATLQEYQVALNVLNQLYESLEAALRVRMAKQGDRSGDRLELEQIRQERINLRKLIEAEAARR